MKINVREGEKLQIVEIFSSEQELTLEDLVKLSRIINAQKNAVADKIMHVLARIDELVRELKERGDRNLSKVVEDLIKIIAGYDLLRDQIIATLGFMELHILMYLELLIRILIEKPEIAPIIEKHLWGGRK